MEILKKRLVNLSLIILVTFIMLLFSEFIIRLLYKDSMVLFPRYQTDVKYGEFTIRRVRPNMKYVHRSIDGNFDFVSNNKGFRNEEDIEYPKSDNEIRILCIGDSNILGYEVKQSQVITTVIKELYEMNQKPYKITVINTGVSGTGTAEQLVFLKNEGVKYKPDYVVLGFFKNDFRNNQVSKLYKVENDSLVVDNLTYTPGVNIQNFIYKFKIVEFLGENSYLYAYAFNTVWQGIANFRYKKAWQGAANLRYKEVSEKEKVEMADYVLETRNIFLEYDILLMRKLIEDMYNFCQKIDAPLIIIDFPLVDLSSSIPHELVNDFRDNSDTLFYANDLRKDFLSLPKVHVKNGYRHVSEETHHLFANKIINFIDSE